MQGRCPSLGASLYRPGPWAWPSATCCHTPPLQQPGPAGAPQSSKPSACSAGCPGAGAGAAATCPGPAMAATSCPPGSAAACLRPPPPAHCCRVPWDSPGRPRRPTVVEDCLQVGAAGAVLHLPDLLQPAALLAKDAPGGGVGVAAGAPLEDGALLRHPGASGGEVRAGLQTSDALVARCCGVKGGCYAPRGAARWGGGVAVSRKAGRCRREGGGEGAATAGERRPQMGLLCWHQPRLPLTAPLPTAAIARTCPMNSTFTMSGRKQ